MDHAHRTAFARDFPHGDRFDGLFEELSAKADRHILGAPAKRVFADSFDPHRADDMTIVVPSVNVWRPTMWSIWLDEHEGSFSVYVNEMGYATTYSTDYAPTPPIWPEAPFTDETVPLIERDRLLDAIARTRKACGDAKDCMSFALALLVNLCAEQDVDTGAALPFHASKMSSHVTFASHYANLTRRPLRTRTQRYDITGRDMIGLMSCGNAIQITIPETTQVLAHDRTWAMTSCPHIITFVMTHDLGIVAIDNRFCIRYDEGDLQRLLDSRKRPQWAGERLWLTMMQGDLIATKSS